MAGAGGRTEQLEQAYTTKIQWAREVLKDGYKKTPSRVLKKELRKSEKKAEESSLRQLSVWRVREETH